MSEAARSVPRSMEASGGPAVRRVSSQRVARPNGWWGVVVLVASEATLFGALFGSYFFLRFKSVTWPPPGIEPPKVVVPLILAGVLATTSVPMAIASHAARAGRLRLTRVSILLALVVQSGYFAYAIHAYRSDLDKFTPQDNAYGSIYFTLLGADHAHVAIGLLLNAFLLARLATGLTAYRAVGVRAASLYWHFVNLLTLLVIGAILSASV